MFATLAFLVAAPAAGAATLSVDDNHLDCPGAPYSSVQAAIDAASPGDTITICPGTYVEGTGAVGSSGLTINKNLTIKGAGAALVTIQPKRSTPYSGQIADALPILRDTRGNIITVVGGSAFPVNVDIGGVTIDANGVYSEIGVLYLDATGTMLRDRVVNVATSLANNADSIPGGYRSNNVGIGVAQMTTATSTPPGATPRTLLIDHSQIERYNKIGVLIDSATNDTPPLTPSGVTNKGVLKGAVITGRIQCRNTDPVDINGNCTTNNVGLTTTGPLFGQDGLRATAGSNLTVTDSIISSNLVNGVGAPTRNATTNNANLPLGAGVRLIGASASSFARNNIIDNAYGIRNVQLDGSTANTAVPASAENNWWGLRFTGVTNNAGPVVSPTTNPQIPENPVNGTAVVDATCVTTNLSVVSNSNAVDFCPFRNGNQGDPNTGQFPPVVAPIAMSDLPPTVSLSTDASEYERGGTVTATANFADDFGVRVLTFFDGATKIGTATPPNGQFQFVVPMGAPCAGHELTVVAEDSDQQQAVDTADFDVTDPLYDCTDPPTVDLTVPGTISEAGTNATATATADPSVTQVDFLLGARHLCTDTTFPYSCNVLANGDEVGSQTVRAVATDSYGRTVEDNQVVTVSKFTPGLTINTQKNSAKKRTISGAVTLPARVNAAQGCASGSISLTIKRGSSLVTTTTLPLSSSCTYSTKLTLSKKAKKNSLSASAQFSGNTVLLPASNNRRFS